MRWAMLTLVAVLLLTSCSEDSPEEPAPAPELSTNEAAELCTEIVNQAVVGPDLPSPDQVYVGVLGAIADGGEPAAATRATWANELTDHLEAAAATKERLTSVAPAEVVSSYDGAVEVLEQRAGALTDGTWVQVRVAFGKRIDPPDVGVGDCAVVFTPYLVQPPEQWREFTADAATICTEIANRRLLGGFAADSDRGPTDADIDQALGRIAAEWRSTADDFAIIDAATSPAPSAWAALGDLAAERVATAEQRRAAIATSNDAAIAAAFAEPDYRLRSFGWELLLLEGRSCGGLTA